MGPVIIVDLRTLNDMDYFLKWNRETESIVSEFAWSCRIYMIFTSRALENVRLSVE